MTSLIIYCGSPIRICPGDKPSTHEIEKILNGGCDKITQKLFLWKQNVMFTLNLKLLFFFNLFYIHIFYIYFM